MQTTNGGGPARPPAAAQEHDQHNDRRNRTPSAPRPPWAPARKRDDPRYGVPHRAWELLLREWPMGTSRRRR